MSFFFKKPLYTSKKNLTPSIVFSDKTYPFRELFIPIISRFNKLGTVVKRIKLYNELIANAI